MPQTAPLSSITIGDIKVTFLPDGGGIVNPLALYPASSEDGWQTYPELLDDEGKFITTIGAFLIETPDQKIAVDLGIGPVHLDFPGFGPFFGGKYMESVKEAGVRFEDVSQVVFTHLHLDHCGWVTYEKEGKRHLTFPNAKYLVTQTEWDFWYNDESGFGPHPEFARDPMQDNLEFIQGGDSITPDISVIDTSGHTPGHVSLLITQGEERLYLVGDILHGMMQLQEADWSVAFDVDQDLARQSRENLYPQLMQPNTIVAANHFCEAIFGRIVEVDGQRTWQPV